MEERLTLRVALLPVSLSYTNAFGLNRATAARTLASSLRTCQPIRKSLEPAKSAENLKGKRLGREPRR